MFLISVCTLLCSLGLLLNILFKLTCLLKTGGMDVVVCNVVHRGDDDDIYVHSFIFEKFEKHSKELFHQMFLTGWGWGGHVLSSCRPDQTSLCGAMNNVSTGGAVIGPSCSWD